MRKNPYYGKTLAYRRFHDSIWKTQELLESGVAGIDTKVDHTFGDLLKKLEAVKGVPGPRPKEYQPKIEGTSNPDGGVNMKMDLRSAAYIKSLIEHVKKRHDNLRFFLYSNMYASVWAAFETYNQMLFEELLNKRPEMLKSKEMVTVESVVASREAIIEYLVERQVEIIGHFKVTELFDYLKSKIGFAPSPASIAKLKDYYFVRNIIAHKSGIVRDSQVSKLPAGVRCVKDELQISLTSLKVMMKDIERTVTSIEKMVESKFFK